LQAAAVVALDHGVARPPDRMALADDLVLDTNQLAVEAILGLLNEGERCRAATADATGGRNIKMAQDLRRRLSTRTRARKLSRADALAVAAGTRASFRAAIYGKLVLPSGLASLAA